MAEQEIDALWAKLSELNARLERHLGECGIRHAEIIRRQDEGARDRQDMREKMLSAMTALAEKFEQAHRDNQEKYLELIMSMDKRLGDLERRGYEKWMAAGGAIIAALTVAAASYYGMR